MDFKNGLINIQAAGYNGTSNTPGLSQPQFLADQLTLVSQPRWAIVPTTLLFAPPPSPGSFINFYGPVLKVSTIIDFFDYQKAYQIQPKSYEQYRVTKRT